MKKLCLVLSCLLWLVAKVSAVVVGPFPGLDKMIEQSDVVLVVRIEPFPVATNGNVIRVIHDHWDRYECMVMQVLKGTVPEKRNLKLMLCGAITDWPYSFSVDTTYLVFLKKDSSGYSDFRAPPIYGAVMRASPFTQELKGSTLLERIAHVIREGRDFCKKLHDREQRVFSAALGEPLPLLSVPLPAAPAPKR